MIKLFVTVDQEKVGVVITDKKGKLFFKNGFRTKAKNPYLQGIQRGVQFTQNHLSRTEEIMVHTDKPVNAEEMKKDIYLKRFSNKLSFYSLDNQYIRQICINQGRFAR